MRRRELYALTSTIESTILWCRNNGLLTIQMQCPACGNDMTEVADKCGDGVVWSCRRGSRSDRHQQKVSIRYGSFFANSHVSIRDTLHLLYDWSAGTSAKDSSFELNLSKPTVIDMYKLFRNKTSEIANEHLSGAIGHGMQTIEVDECQVGRRKHQRGRIPREMWVVGGVVRDSVPLESFMEVVARRNRQTLENIMRRRVNMSCRLITDDWGGYKHLRDLGFNHFVIRHCDYFVDPQNPEIHTQNIENYWRCLRRFLAKKGTYTRRHIQAYLDEYIFRKRFPDVFETLIQHLQIGNS
jgi:hypothetical protein